MEQLGIFLGALAIAFFFLGPSVFNGILFGGVVYWVVGLFAPSFAIPFIYFYAKSLRSSIWDFLVHYLVQKNRIIDG